MTVLSRDPDLGESASSRPILLDAYAAGLEETRRAIRGRAATR